MRHAMMYTRCTPYVDVRIIDVRIFAMKESTLGKNIAIEILPYSHFGYTTLSTYEADVACPIYTTSLFHD